MTALEQAIWITDRLDWVASVSSAPWAAVIGADLTVLTPRRRWLCLQYLGYQSLGPLLEWRLNDRNVAETVSWATPGDRPDTLHCCPPFC